MKNVSAGLNAVVLASTKGLGKAITINLLEKGYNVAISSRSTENVENTLKELKASFPDQQILGKNLDVSQAEQMDHYFEFVLNEFKSVDVLVTNAGGPPTGQFEDFSDEDWFRAFELNFMSNIRSIRKVLPGMKAKKSGRIIAVTSIAVKAPVANLMLSNSVRAGVTGFIKSLSNEVATYNISVNSVCPGYIHTDRVDKLASDESKRSGESIEEVIKKWESNIPMQRMGTPEEFASLVGYLCTEKAGYITGATFWMDGGRYPGLL